MVPPSSAPFDIHAQCHAGSFVRATASKSKTFSASPTLAMRSGAGVDPDCCAISDGRSSRDTSGLAASSWRKRLRSRLVIVRMKGRLEAALTLLQVRLKPDTTITSGPAKAGHYDHVRLKPDTTSGRYFSGPSFGAPVPDDPMNSRLPPGRIMSAPLARLAPFFALYPSMVTSVPASRDRLLKPRLTKVFGVPPSIIQRVTVPSGFFTSR